MKRLKLGALQKKMLLAMLEIDERLPPLTVVDPINIVRFHPAFERASRKDEMEALRLIPVWMPLNEYAHDYTVRRVSAWRAVCRLLERRFILKRTIVLGARKFTGFRLSVLGRKVAKRLRFETRLDELRKVEGEHLDSAVREVRKEFLRLGQPPLATPEQILEALWNATSEWYERDRKTFEEYWTKRKLGAEMKRKGYRLIRRRQNGKNAWAYGLVKEEQNLQELKAALLYLHRLGFSNVEVPHIQTAIWLLWKDVYASPEVVKSFWNGKTTGNLMRKLGFKPRRLKSGREKRYNIDETSGWELPADLMETVEHIPRLAIVFAEGLVHFTHKITDEA
jgi:hypothetical protein